MKILNSREPNQAWGLFNVSLERVESPKAYDFLWTKYRIITAAIKRDDYQGLRVTPNVYTTLEEVDTFAGAIEDLLKNARRRRPRRTGTRRWELGLATCPGTSAQHLSAYGRDVQDAVHADLRVLVLALPGAARDERQIGPAIEQRRPAARSARRTATRRGSPGSGRRASLIASIDRSSGKSRTALTTFRYDGGKNPL